jgi:hypothetical protein
MHKRPGGVSPGRDSNAIVVRGTLERPPFRISSLARHHYSGGSKLASFKLEIEAVAEVQCDVFQFEGALIVRPAAVCDRRSGLWVRRVKLDPELLEDVTAAVAARLEADTATESA